GVGVVQAVAAYGEAAVSVAEVGVVAGAVALLAGVLHPVAAGADLAVVVAVGIATGHRRVAALADGDIDDTVAAALVGEAIGAAAISGDVAAVVADLADRAVDDVVAAGLVGAAVGAAAVAVDDVAVVADLADVDDPVAAGLAG